MQRTDIRVRSAVELLLLFVLLYSAAGGIARSMSGPAWAPLWQAVVLGSLLGWLGGAIGVRPLRFALFCVLTGFGFAVLSGGRLTQPLSEVALEVFGVLGQFAALRDLALVETAALEGSLAELSQGTAVVTTRVSAWVSAWRSGALVFDPVATTILWALSLWLVSVWAGWWLGARKQPLISTAPAVLLSVITQTYTGTRFGGLYVMLSAGLLLIAAVSYSVRQRQWEGTGIGIPSRLGWEIGKRTLVATAAIVLLAAIVPSVSLKDVRDLFQGEGGAGSGSGSGLGRSLGLEREEEEDPLEKLRRPGLPRDHLIGAGPELSDELVMRVQVQDVDSAEQNLDSLPLYWRALTYDFYTGRSWRSSRTSSAQYSAESLARQGSAPHSIIVGQRVQTLSSEAFLLHAAGEIVSVDHEFSVAVRSSGDVFAVTAHSDGAYRALSLVPVPDEATLRAAGGRYPTWVTNRFLQLPRDLPGRVRTLALELTATEKTPYDRALEIERYLRQIPYTLDVDRAPAGRDLVDFFLFDERRGYCDYYASAMTVLARAAGIPARVAIGYTRGTPDPQGGGYLVTEAEAHSWVELYFPGVGWVPFEPTAARPALDRSHEFSRSLGTLHDSILFFEPREGPSRRPWRSALLAALAGMAAVGASALILDELRLRLLTPLAATAEVNRRLKRMAARYSSDLQLGATPEELAHRIHSELNIPVGRGGPLARLSRATQRDLTALVSWITDVQFRPGAVSGGMGSDPLTAWRRFWCKASALRFLLRIPRFRELFWPRESMRLGRRPDGRRG